jgi:hypothetical protein
VAELLRALALLVEGAMAVTNALLDAILGALGGAITALFDPHDGLLTQPLDIPVLSWLFQTLVGEDLSIVNLITLLGAIPVTLLWRLVKGEWPSQSLGPQATATAARAAESDAAVDVFGLFDGVGAIVMGFVTAAGTVFDQLVPNSGSGQGTGSASVWMARVVTICSLVHTTLFVVEQTAGRAKTALDWIAWAVDAVAGVLFGLIDYLIRSPQVKEGSGKFWEKAIPIVTCALSLLLLGLFIYKFVSGGEHNPVDSVEFAVEFCETVPGICQPLVLGGPELQVVVAAIELFIGLWVGGVTIALALGAGRDASSLAAARP